jgi:uncharacterized DUF497 family protein
LKKLTESRLAKLLKNKKILFSRKSNAFTSVWVADSMLVASVSFAETNSETRLISARKMSKREREIYENG